MTALETDYLIIGAGAMSLAFADELHRSQPNARMVIVDRRGAPGGHWVDAYPFVCLHQPALAYGVNSAPLGRGGGDLSSRSEILAYYERVLRRLTDSGRVTAFFRSEVDEAGQIVSLLDTRDPVSVTVRKRVVDGGYMHVEVPATHPPRFEIAPGVRVLPPNALVDTGNGISPYVVVGAGKTGIDAILFLLGHGVAADRIHWIVSNDMWLWNRAHVQLPGVGDELLGFVQAIAQASDLDDVFARLEARGSLLRLSDAVLPTRWRCATVSAEELTALRTIRQVIRLGRVQQIEPGQITLDQGTVQVPTDAQFINCTANGLRARPARPLFTPDRITLQPVFMCQQVLSAAVIARMEAQGMDDASANALWEVVPHPDQAADLPDRMVTTMRNLLRAQPSMGWWLRRSRLNILSHLGWRRYLSVAVKARHWLPRAEANLGRLDTPDG